MQFTFRVSRESRLLFFGPEEVVDADKKPLEQQKQDERKESADWPEKRELKEAGFGDIESFINGARNERMDRAQRDADDLRNQKAEIQRREERLAKELTEARGRDRRETKAAAEWNKDVEEVLDPSHADKAYAETAPVMAAQDRAQINAQMEAQQPAAQEVPRVQQSAAEQVEARTVEAQSDAGKVADVQGIDTGDVNLKQDQRPEQGRA